MYTPTPKETAKLHSMLDYCIKRGIDIDISLRRQTVQLDRADQSTIVLPIDMLENVRFE